MARCIVRRLLRSLSYIIIIIIIIHWFLIFRILLRSYIIIIIIVTLGGLGVIKQPFFAGIIWDHRIELISDLRGDVCAVCLKVVDIFRYSMVEHCEQIDSN